MIQTNEPTQMHQGSIICADTPFDPSTHRNVADIKRIAELEARQDMLRMELEAARFPFTRRKGILHESHQKRTDRKLKILENKISRLREVTFEISERKHRFREVSLKVGASLAQIALIGGIVWLAVTLAK